MKLPSFFERFSGLTTKLFILFLVVFGLEAQAQPVDLQLKRFWSTDKAEEQLICLSYTNVREQDGRIRADLSLGNSTGTWVYVKQNISSPTQTARSPVPGPPRIYLLEPFGSLKLGTIDFPKGSYIQFDAYSPLGLGEPELGPEADRILLGAVAIDLMTRGPFNTELPSNAFNNLVMGSTAVGLASIDPLFKTITSHSSGALGALGYAVVRRDGRAAVHAIGEFVLCTKKIKDVMKVWLSRHFPGQVAESYLKWAAKEVVDILDVPTRATLIGLLTKYTFSAPTNSWNRIEVVESPRATKEVNALPKVISGLKFFEHSPYYVGQQITSRFTIENKGTAPITFQKLCVGGGGPGGDNDVQDFTHRTVTLKPRQLYNYQGELVLKSPGQYHFFIAYQTPDGKWNTSVPAGEGIRRALDIEVINPPAYESDEQKGMIARRDNNSTEYKGSFGGSRKPQERVPARLPISKNRFPDGTLLKAKGANEVYLIQNGMKCYIPDPETFNANGYDWNMVVEIDKRNLDRIRTGIPIPSVKYTKEYGSQRAAGSSFNYWGKDKEQGSPQSPHQQAQPYPSGQAVPPQPSTTDSLSPEQRTLWHGILNTMSLDELKDSHRQMKQQWEERFPNIKSDPGWQKLMGWQEKMIRMKEEDVQIQKGIIARRHTEHPRSVGSRKLQNRAPVARIYADRTSGIVAPGKTLHVNLSARNSYDPDGDKLRYQWYIDGSPAARSRDFGFQFGKGIHNVRLTVSDGELEGSAGIKIAIREEVVQRKVQPRRALPGHQQRLTTTGKKVTVANTGGYGLKLRAGPGLKYPKKARLAEGMSVIVVGGPHLADGYIWWNVSSPAGQGWCAVGDWLVPTPRVGITVTVANTGGYGLKLRKRAGTNDRRCPKITTLSDGTKMKVVAGPVRADGYTWWLLQGYPGGVLRTGWSPVGDWLIPNPH